MKKKFIKAIAVNLTRKLKKKKCLKPLEHNKEKIGQDIPTIKLSNKLIRKLGKRIEKYIRKIEEKDSDH